VEKKESRNLNPGLTARVITDDQRSDWVNMSVLLYGNDIPGSSLAGIEKLSRAEN